MHHHRDRAVISHQMSACPCKINADAGRLDVRIQKKSALVDGQNVLRGNYRTLGGNVVGLGQLLSSQVHKKAFDRLGDMAIVEEGRDASWNSHSAGSYRLIAVVPVADIWSSFKNCREGLDVDADLEFDSRQSPRLKRSLYMNERLPRAPFLKTTRNPLFRLHTSTPYFLIYKPTSVVQAPW